MLHSLQRRCIVNITHLAIGESLFFISIPPWLPCTYALSPRLKTSNLASSGEPKAVVI